jgi:hypothetical protein
MNNFKHLKTFCLLILLIGSSLLLISQEKPETIREQVNVVNLEVPIRVFAKGKPVENLTREDFKIFEANEEQTINGFYIRRKKIKMPDGPSLPSRYFVLVFNINEYSKQLGEGLDYLFKNMLRKNDQLMVFSSQKTVFFNGLPDKDNARSKIDLLLKEQSHAARIRMADTMSKLKNITTPGIEDDERAFNYLKIYFDIWKEYKKKYLQPDVDRYYNFARGLKKIKKEKWVINFFQAETFPHLGRNHKKKIFNIINRLNQIDGKHASYSNLLHRLILRLDKELNAADDFPAEGIGRLFYGVGATFHSIIIPTIKPATFQFSDGFEKKSFEEKRVSTNFENTLRQITKKTGGTLIFSKNMRSALGVIEEKEDICYYLTYVPNDPGNIGEITVKVNRRRHDIVYDNNIKSYYMSDYLAKKKQEIPAIQFQKYEFSEKILKLVIDRYSMKNRQDVASGQINVRVRIKDEKNVVLFDENKMLTPKDSITTVSLPFKWLPKGKYDIIMDIRDLVTGSEDQKFLQPEVL